MNGTEHDVFDWIHFLLHILVLVVCIPNERLHSTVIGRTAGHIELSEALGSFLDALRLSAGVVVNAKDRRKEGDYKHAHGAERRRLGRLGIFKTADEEGLCR